MNLVAFILFCVLAAIYLARTVFYMICKPKPVMRSYKELALQAILIASLDICIALTIGQAIF